ncbi:MAG: XRE family transcriptional regulator [Proteobacteria bacterium]|nr:XRE family transcriptional regulator [Pseudomonadota bacterium]
MPSPEQCKQIFHIRNVSLRKVPSVAKSFDQQFARFLRQQRGDLTYSQFARKLGIAPSTLFRLEHASQSVTLGKLEEILKRLKLPISDVFS